MDTIAGKCGEAGFKDGIMGANLLNSPELVGVDNLGYIFIYDAGNKYIRMLDLDMTMYTLI